MNDTLGNITSKIGSGATPRGGQNAYKEKGITLIRSMNVYDFHFSMNGLAFIDEEQAKKLNNVQVKEGDILFNITGDSINRTCIVPKDLLPARVNQHVSIIRCKKGIDSRYVNYYLINLKPYLMQICGVGGTRNALTKEALTKLPIKIPKNHSQLAKVLSDLDAKIELNNKINAELEAMAKLIYDYWFVQFEFPCLPQDYSPRGNLHSGRPSGQVNPNFDLNEKIRSFCTYKQTGGLPLPDGKTWFVYVLLCDDGSFYKGMTNDLYRRYYEHGTGQGAHHTKVHKPVKVIHWEQFETQEAAALREKELKTGFGRTWLQREYKKLQKQQEKPGLPAHQNARPSKLMPAGKMVWNEELKREVPEGWEVGMIKDYCPSTGGFAFKSSWWSDSGVSVVKIKDIQENYTINLSDLSKAKVDGINIDGKFRAKSGDVLIAMTGATIGKYAIVPKYDNEIYVNQRVGHFKLENHPVMKLPFLINSLNQKYFRETIYRTAGGAAQPNISNEQINNIELIKPQKELVNEYNVKFSSFYKKIINNQYENQKLAELRDWLLPMLMNGQVKVSSQDEMLNMAAEPEVNYGKEISLNDKRKAIAACIILNSEYEEFFGKVKFEKLLHLSEYHALKEDNLLNYKKYAAGPLDTKFTYGFINEAISHGLISIDEKKKLQRIRVKDKKQLQKLTDSELNKDTQLKIGELVRQFLGSNYEKPEIVSTLYAAWDNRIIKNELINDELIKKDFLDWSEGKKKYEKKLDMMLEWMRSKGIVPDGWGEVV